MEAWKIGNFDYALAIGSELAFFSPILQPRR